MYRIVACIAYDHNPLFLTLPVIVCVVGSYISVLLTRQLTYTTGRIRMMKLGLASIIGGATIWSTHFLAMLAYEPGLPHGYDPFLTGLSMGVAITGVLVANSILAFGRQKYHALTAGAVFGLTVSAMHYAGMSAYLLPGYLIWDVAYKSASVILGSAIGATTYYVISRNNIRYARLKVTLLMVGAICAMHFTGMAAFTIELSSAVTVPDQVISDAVLGAIIMAVTVVILLIGFAAFSIEANAKAESHDQLEHAARHDPLTGLSNRLGLTKKLDEYNTRLAQDETERVAVLTIDLNLFKQVNDLYGHAAGDKILTTLADRFKHCIEENEFVARTGGDEFVAFKRGFRRVEQAVAFAERLHAVVVEPIDLGDASTIVGASVGIATSIDDMRDMETLLHHSDLAMYRAKSVPEINICMFNAEIDQQSHEKNVLIHDLRRALENDQFELVYQLQNRVSSRDPIGFEVLLRWNHPARGRISPAEFIPLAEETGLIREIGLWVLRTACKEASKWAYPYAIAVNVAPQQLVQPSFVEHVSDALFETQLDPERLELEVTEASIIDDHANTLKVMHKLKQMGIRIAMDDFGTGYSSLATLQAFPFDKIKIDRSFVQDVHKHKQRAAIVRSTLLLGNALDIPVLAEGVETEDELQFLQGENCDSAEGFLFGKQLSHEELMRFLENVEKKQAS